ncbi:hypothetical protein UlMin_026591 [Ulmus minor]
MIEEEVNRCQIQEWYSKFKSISIKTRIHKLPESFIQYLLNDSGPFLLPATVTNEDALPNRIHNLEEEDYQVSERSDDESEQPCPPPSFPELEMEIKESIESLGGAIFPKLNCDKTLSRPCSFFLAFRKWYPSLCPEMEFRCFVMNQNLVGISRREVTTFYLALPERKNNLRALLHDFFNYTFDVYVTGDERVKVVDFNPWGAFTLPLLFTREELERNHGGEDEEKQSVKFRIVESRCAVRPALKTAVPYDYLDTTLGSGWDQFLKNADEELRRHN